MKYILDGKKAILTEDLKEWSGWFETAKRHVGDDTIGEARVSTVFLGLDHNYSGGEPLLFETMIFGGKYHEFQKRYSTYEEAELGHKIIVKVLNV